MHKTKPMKRIGIFELFLYTRTLTENIRTGIKNENKELLKSHKIFRKWLRIRKK